MTVLPKLEYQKLELDNWVTRLSRRGSINLAARVVLEEKNMCFGSMYQGERVYLALKTRPTNLSTLTGLEV